MTFSPPWFNLRYFIFLGPCRIAYPRRLTIRFFFFFHPLISVGKQTSVYPLGETRAHLRSKWSGLAVARIHPDLLQAPMGDPEILRPAIVGAIRVQPWCRVTLLQNPRTWAGLEEPLGLELQRVLPGPWVEPDGPGTVTVHLSPPASIL